MFEPYILLMYLAIQDVTNFLWVWAQSHNCRRQTLFSTLWMWVVAHLLLLLLLLGMCLINHKVFIRLKLYLFFLCVNDVVRNITKSV